MALEKKLVVGITFYVSETNSDIWATGAIQNVIYLYMLMQKIPFVAEVILINGGDGECLSPSLHLGGMDIRVARLSEVIQDLDVLIEAGAQILVDDARLAKAHGVKLVAYRMGNDFVIDMERTIFNQRSGYLFQRIGFDEIWTLPHHEHTCKSYWKIMERCAVRTLPYIWSPIFLQKGCDELGHGLKFGYVADADSAAKNKKIAIFEPNINVVKTCHYPLLLCEAAYRIRPELFKAIYVTNTSHIKSNTTFQNFIGTMDIARDGIATIEDRYRTPYFLAAHASVVVSHQWENELNNLYLDVLYGGYPLIHNSKTLKAGYYYPAFDAEAGAEILLDVLANHDKRHIEYRERAKSYLTTIDVDCPENVERYGQALAELF